MKKLAKICLCLFMTMIMVGNQSSTVIADEDYSNSEYWLNRCTNYGKDDASACEAYKAYLESQNAEMSQQIEAWKAQKADMEANITKYAAKISEYQIQIDTKQAEITQKEAEIDAKQKEIDYKQAEIEQNQQTADKLQDKVKTRMVLNQPTMRTNQYIDILMGANNFTDFIRMEKQDQQKELITLQTYVQIAQEAAQKTAAALRGSIETKNSDIAQNNALMAGITAQIEAIPTTNGWTYPVDGAWRSAGTWSYPDGSIHLGYDFAASYGATIRAVANGVVLRGVNGCPTVGYLGDSCGYQFGGASYSGNQVILLVTVNGSLYGVDYFHMTLNTPAATGTIVNAGDVIGQVGSSGNTTGPHCHVEIFYLGDASNFAYYAANWNGDVSFGAGWTGGRYGLYGRRCSDGVGAPCRIQPEEVFGY